jgi:hypothetical protein
MDGVIAALILIALVLTGSLLLVQRFFVSQEAMMLDWLATEDRLAQRMRTALTPLTAETVSSGAVVELVLANTGQTRLADFEQWDVIVEYESVQGYVVTWLPYVVGEPGLDEWTVVGIYLDAATATAEIYDPDIVNAGEELLIRVRLSPPVKVGSNNLARVVVPNGVGASMAFSR